MLELPNDALQEACWEEIAEAERSMLELPRGSFTRYSSMDEVAEAQRSML
jgi:hypothetical protein